tara:strand:+ start:184 stop:477 length:294 start_codon:yes stop_codon:yes gene_type:complete
MDFGRLVSIYICMKTPFQKYLVESLKSSSPIIKGDLDISTQFENIPVGPLPPGGFVVGYGDDKAYYLDTDGDGDPDIQIWWDSIRGVWVNADGVEVP